MTYLDKLLDGMEGKVSPTISFSKPNLHPNQNTLTFVGFTKLWLLPLQGL